MSTNPLGLMDFLHHISRQPYHPTLVERYLSLAFELPGPSRCHAMDQLHRVLVQPNPSLALRCHYHYRLHIRAESRRDSEEDIFVLELIQSCFQELGRMKQARLIREEIARVRQEQSARMRPYLVKEHPVETSAGHDPLEQLGENLFLDFKQQLGSFPTIRHQRLAVEKLIQSLDALYQKSGRTIARAIQDHGRNPLLWTRSGELRPALVHYLMQSRVFQMGQDTLTAMRMAMILEMLTAYYDQRQRAECAPDDDHSTRLRMLSEMMGIFLDAGVSFPAYIRGAS